MIEDVVTAWRRIVRPAKPESFVDEKRSAKARFQHLFSSTKVALRATAQLFNEQTFLMVGNEVSTKIFGAAFYKKRRLGDPLKVAPVFEE